MAEKRFTISMDSNDRKSLWDDERTEEEPLIALNRFGEIWGIDDCCKLLNSLNDEVQLARTVIQMKREQISSLAKSNYEGVKKVQSLAKENEKLKKELFEARKDYILETYTDNPIRRDEKLKALEKELQE